jgi:hypothetical protein
MSGQRRPQAGGVPLDGRVRRHSVLRWHRSSRLQGGSYRSTTDDPLDLRPCSLWLRTPRLGAAGVCELAPVGLAAHHPPTSPTAVYSAIPASSLTPRRSAGLRTPRPPRFRSLHARLMKVVPPDAAALRIPVDPPSREYPLPRPRRPCVWVLGIQTPRHLDPSAPFRQVTAMQRLDTPEMLPEWPPHHLGNDGDPVFAALTLAGVRITRRRTRSVAADAADPLRAARLALNAR